MSRFTDHLGRDRRMIAPDEPGEQRDGNADQRRADEEIREARTLDDEARGARKQASRQCAERSHQRILAGGEPAIWLSRVDRYEKFDLILRRATIA